MPNKKKRMYMIFALVALAGIILILSSINVGVGLVRDQAVKTANDMLSADLMISDVNGNPFRGYTIDGVHLIHGGRTLLTFRQITVKPRLLSLLSGSVKISSVGIDGFKSDVDSINAVVGSLKTGGGGGENPVEKIRITGSEIDSEWVSAKINDISVAFSGNDIDTDLDLGLNDLPLKGVLNVSWNGSDLAIEKMDIHVGKGEISAAGSILPALTVKGQADDLDIARLISFWPDAKSSSYEGSFSGSFETSGSWEDPGISGTLSYSGKKLAGFPVSRGSSKWKYEAYRLDVADLSADPLGVPVDGDLAFQFGKGAVPKMFIDMGAKSVNLASLKDFSPKLSEVSGVVDELKVKMQGSIAEPDGRIDLKAGNLDLMGYAVKNTDIGISISKGDMTLSGKSEYDNAPISFSGTLSSFMTSPVFNIRGSMRSLNLASLGTLLPAVEDLGAEGILNGDVRISGKADVPEISGKVWSRKLSVMKEEISDPSTLFKFASDTLTLSGIKAGWRGAGISGGGTISSLMTESRKIDMQIGADGLDSSFFEGFVPALSRYSLQGKVSALLSLKGALTDPVIGVELVSDSLKIMNDYKFGGLKASTSLSGIPKTVPESLKLDMSSSWANLAGVPLKNIALELDKRGNSLNMSRGEALIGNGSLSASGNVILGTGGKSPDLDLRVKVSSIALEALVSSIEGMPDVKGAITGDLTVKGPLSNPSFTLAGSSPAITAAGMEVRDISASAAGDMDLVKIDKLQAKAGGGTIDVSGQVKPKAADTDISVKGNGLDLAVLTAGFPKAREFGVGGNIDLAFKGHFDKTGNNGSGLLSSAETRGMGIRVENISCPLSLKDNILSTDDAKADLYGGTAKAKGSIDLNTMKFSKEVEAEGVDVDAVLRDAFGLQGHITGKARLFAKLGGSMDGGLSYSGSGLLKMGEGAVSDFKGISLIGALYGIKSINYQSVYAPFDIGTGYISLKDETNVSAYESDPLYKSFSAKGKVGPESKLDLLCSGKLNIRIIKMLAGGVAGGLTAEKSITGLLKGIVQGAGQQSGQDDFRDVSFKLGGTFGKPRISGVKADLGSAQQSTQTTEQTSESLQETQSVDDSDGGTDAKEDLKEQIKEKVLRQLFN